MRFALSALAFAVAAVAVVVSTLVAQRTATEAHTPPPPVEFKLDIALVSDPDGVAEHVSMPPSMQMRLYSDLHDGGLFLLAGSHPWQHTQGTFSGDIAPFGMVGYGGGDELTALFDGTLAPNDLSGTYQLTVDDRDVEGIVVYSVQSAGDFPLDFSTRTPTPSPVPTTPQPTATPTSPPVATSTPAPMATATSTLPATATPPQWPPGDVTQDGRTNSLDAAIVLQISAGMLSESDLDAGKRQRADVNIDGAITAVDAQLMLQYSAGFIDALPV